MSRNFKKFNSNYDKERNIIKNLKKWEFEQHETTAPGVVKKRTHGNAA